MKVKAKAIQLVSTILVLLLGATALLAVSSVVVHAQTTQSTKREEIQEKIQQKRQEVLDRQEARKEARGEKREEQRVAACERNSAKLVKAMERLTGKAERHLSVISSFQTKVENFYAKGQLTVENYDELYSAVVAAQEKATNNVTALSEVEVDIDCSDSEVATAVGLYRVIANDTRDTLKEYRKSLVALISAMRAEASEDSDDDSEDETSSENEDETEAGEQENEAENEPESEDSSEPAESEDR